MVKRLMRYIGTGALLCFSRCAFANDGEDSRGLRARWTEGDNAVPARAPTHTASLAMPTISSRRLANPSDIRPSTTVDICSFVPDVFNSTVVAEAVGNPEEFDLTQQATVEALIREAYNNVTKTRLCDELSREIFSVSVSNFELVETNRRRLNSSRRRFFFRFVVTGTCRACSRDTKLYTDVAFERRLMEATPTRGLQGMTDDGNKEAYHGSAWSEIPDLGPNVFSLGETRSGNSNAGLENTAIMVTTAGDSSPTDSPTPFPTSSPTDQPTPFPTKNPTAAPAQTISSRRSCECRNEDGDKRSPYTDEFVDQFNQVLARDGTVTSIDKLTGVAEVEESDCGEPANEFNSQALLYASGNSSLLTDTDKENVGVAFITSYNELAGQNCDPFFRTGLSAEVTIEEVFDTDSDDSAETISGAFADSFNEAINNGSLRRGLLSIVNEREARSLNQRGRSFRFRMDIRGRCLGCSSNSRLFNDPHGSGRRLHIPVQAHSSSSIQTRHLGFLSDDGKCYCAPNAPKQAPDTSNFTVTFQNEIDDLEDRGEITDGGVGLIDKTVQVDPTLPSSMPSMMPSIAPTDEPTTSPSAAPSSSPSDSPSTIPTVAASDVPTDSPSASPSAMPSASPSDAPTSSPSESPSDAPSLSPSASPSDAPSSPPSESPTDSPSSTPSAAPSPSPSESPTDSPSASPTGLIPTESPMPSPSPSVYPTDRPSSSPSNG